MISSLAVTVDAVVTFTAVSVKLEALTEYSAEVAVVAGWVVEAVVDTDVVGMAGVVAAIVIGLLTICGWAGVVEVENPNEFGESAAERT